MNAKLEQLWGGYQFPFVTSQITFHKKVEHKGEERQTFMEKCALVQKLLLTRTKIDQKRNPV